MMRIFITAVLISWSVISIQTVKGSENHSKLRIPQIKYSGGNFLPRPEGILSLLTQVAKRTSVEVKRQAVLIDLTDPELFQFPMVYLSGDAAFQPLKLEAINILRDYLSFGGFLFVDDSSSIANSTFDGSVRTMISNLFPNIPLQKIPRDHSIFRSFYLINRIAGRVLINPFLEGITIKGRTVLLYSTNDLGGAWSTNKLGHWNYDIVGGGGLQRKIAVRLGVNIVLYAMTLDYKKDMVHLPIILERLRRYHGQ